MRWLVAHEGHSLPNTAGNKPPNKRGKAELPVEGDDTLAAFQASQDVACGTLAADKHRVVLIGVEDVGSYKAWAYVAEKGGYMLHTHVLCEGDKIGALHTLRG